ncbi:MAG: ADP/ATP-dependent (S)-NAD(P)H-hydrate dehydratase, partial [Bacteroidota bacterium]
RTRETLELVLKLIPGIDRPLILDADALFALAGHVSVLKKRRQPTILTPHTGELGAIIGQDSTAIDTNRVEVSQESANKLRSILCLKGSPTATATQRGKVYLNPTGNPGMATIGSGDVLTGIIGGLLGQGMSPNEAAFSGVFIHGLAGDIAAAKLGQRSLMAMDILDHLPGVLKRLES